MLLIFIIIQKQIRNNNNYCMDSHSQHRAEDRFACDNNAILRNTVDLSKWPSSFSVLHYLLLSCWFYWLELLDSTLYTDILSSIDWTFWKNIFGIGARFYYACCRWHSEFSNQFRCWKRMWVESSSFYYT